jgi:outer membrane protein insertion porin family
LTSINFQGNKKFKNEKLLKKISSRVGEPLDERKLFTDTQTIREMYQKAGYPGTEVKYVPTIDESNGRGSATFEITEGRKIKIEAVEFVEAQAFSQRKLGRSIKTRKKWIFTGLSKRGIFKEEQFEDDRELLAQFYRNHGYIDFEIKDVKFEYPSPNRMIIRIFVYEGRQYKVGAVTFEGTTMFPTNTIQENFKLKPGEVFVPSQLGKDIGRVEDFYGSKGYIDVTTSSGSPPNLRVRRVPNTETGTIDLHYKVSEGGKSYVEKIEIRGNTKTKDRVIRRELAVSPGETFDMVRVKVSQRRLEGLQYFSKVDLRPEPTDVVDRKNLVVSVEEKNTGNLSFGAGFSSVDSIVGFVELSQGNFDLFHPPTFTGAGQKFRLRVQLGTERQDYVLTFIEPWFLGRKLSLGMEAYYRDLNFQSTEDLYDETRAGVKMSLTRALWTDFLIGTVSYTIENVGIHLDNSSNSVAQTPPTIAESEGYSLLSRLGVSLAYDTRNSTKLPDGGQRTELFAEAVGGPLGGEEDFYKLEFKTAWYFRPYFKGHVIELSARTGVAGGINGSSVPFYERWYLGGVYSLRGFDYRAISPRDPNTNNASGFYDEPVGGNTYWFGCAEYSVPIFQTETGVGVRFAVFYDVGSVTLDSFDYQIDDYSDNWGLGLHLDLPIGPLVLEYGFPIHHDQFSDGDGKFQFRVGYTREF